MIRREILLSQKDENGNAIQDEAGKRKMLDSIWGDDGKQDDTNDRRAII